MTIPNPPPDEPSNEPPVEPTDTPPDAPLDEPPSEFPLREEPEWRAPGALEDDTPMRLPREDPDVETEP